MAVKVKGRRTAEQGGRVMKGYWIPEEVIEKVESALNMSISAHLAHKTGCFDDVLKASHELADAINNQPTKSGGE